MLGIYFAGHAIKFNNFNNLFSWRDEKGASVYIFAE